MYTISKGSTGFISIDECKLSDIQGTEKQVQWATSIRDKYYKYAKSYLEKAKPEYWNIYAEAIVRTISKRDAKFWIDNRSRSENDLVHGLLVDDKEFIEFYKNLTR